LRCANAVEGITNIGATIVFGNIGEEKFSVLLNSTVIGVEDLGTVDTPRYFWLEMNWIFYK
jgi:hypothetical protein